MDLDTAKQIADTYYNTRRLIEAIKTLRYETSMGLKQAKNYIEESNSYDELVAKLTKDFIQDKKELLQQLYAEQTRIEQRIATLLEEINNEDSEVAWKAYYTSDDGAETRVLTGEGMVLREIVIEPHGAPGTSIGVVEDTDSYWRDQRYADAEFAQEQERKKS